MKYLSQEDILRLHDLVVQETVGAHGVRDHHLLKSLEGQPQQSVFGKELYPTIFDKAAVYAHRIITNHPFLDGNKRTGMTAAIVFLEDNGHVFIAKEGVVEALALAIATEHIEVTEIALRLKKHSKRRVDGGEGE